MSKRILSIAVFLCAFAAHAETPREAAKVILGLVQNRQYEQLATKRYAEWYKAAAAGVEPDVALARLTAIWERNHAALVDVYEQLAGSDFEVTSAEVRLNTETGKVAAANISVGGKEIAYRLYEMKSGRWGFHQ